VQRTVETPTSAAGRSAAWMAALCALFVVGGIAAAQPTEPDSRWVIVVDEPAPLRAADLERSYEVYQAPVGSMLRAVEALDSWYRVEYPRGVYPFARADEIEQTGPGRGVIARPTRLLHPHAEEGIRGSWLILYADPLPEGTPVRIGEIVRDGDGDVVGYRVRPAEGADVPRPPLAHVKRDAVRPATDSEIESHLESLEQTETSEHGPKPEQRPAESQPRQAQRTTPPSQTQGAADETDQEQPAQREEPASDEPTSDANAAPSETSEEAEGASSDDMPSVDTSLLMPIVEQTPQPNREEAGDATDVEQQAADAGMEPVDEPEPRDPLEVLQELERSVERAGRLDENEAVELREAYSALRARIDSASVRRAIDQRVEVLDLRLDLLRARSELRSTLDNAAARRAELEEAIERATTTTDYTMVGRLTASAIYDGVRLPKMYRLESTVPGTGGRTLGYLRADNDAVTPDLLGRVVGVIGRASLDPTLGLRTIRASRIDLLVPAAN